MISQLTGTLLQKQAPLFVIDCNGVGYEVQAPMTTYYELPKIGETLTIYTHLSIREDAHTLFGFSDQEQRLLFRELVKVNGVGPKLALAILSSMTPGEFVAHVRDGEVNELVRMPGVGKKTAERLIVEMGDRLKDWMETPAYQVVESLQGDVPPQNATKEAVSALIALGYKPQEASKAVAKVNSSEASSEELIKLALKSMG